MRIAPCREPLWPRSLGALPCRQGAAPRAFAAARERLSLPRCRCSGARARGARRAAPRAAGGRAVPGGVPAHCCVSARRHLCRR
ncbi:hypothetical protein D5273_04740 [Enterorhabdus caecimuris]|nr:hypothetical protein [Adlercreutzia caecimuris]